MAHLFISHVENDRSTALELAKLLEESGFKTWYYERDSHPGPSYLIQTGRAIAEAGAVMVIISPASLQSPLQVTNEIVRAYEAGKPFVPMLAGVSHKEFQTRQPEWREAIGAATSIQLPSNGLRSVVPRIVSGLKALGLHEQEGPTRTAEGDRKTETGRGEIAVYTMPIRRPGRGFRGVVGWIISALKALWLDEQDGLPRTVELSQRTLAERIEVQRIIAMFPDIRERKYCD